jgi:hypothetical protein
MIFVTSREMGVRAETGQTMIMDQLQAAGYSASQAQEVLLIAERLMVSSRSGGSSDYKTYSQAQSRGYIRDVERLMIGWRAVSPRTTRISDLSSVQSQEMLNRRDFPGFMGPQTSISIRWTSDTTFDLTVGNQTLPITLPPGFERSLSIAERNRDDMLTLVTARSMVDQWGGFRQQRGSFGRRTYTKVTP